MDILKKDSDKKAKTHFGKLFYRMPINGYRVITPHRFGGVIDTDITGTDYAYMNRESHFKNLVKMKYTPCPYPWYGMSIYYDGSVLPCCLNFFDNYIIGDANKQSLKEIWNGKPMTHLRERLAKGENKSISMCSECDFLYQTSVMGISTKAFADAATFIREILND